MGYKLKIRNTAPSNTDKHWIHYTANGYNTACIIDNKTKSCIPNCVGYNMGRIAECLRAISQSTFEKWQWKIPVCNAEDCYNEAKKNGLKVGLTPKIGASIVWRKGKTHNESDGCGHIMFVEGLYTNGDILVSGSNYNGTRFYTKRITKASGYYFANGYTLVGFIYFPVTYDVEYLDKTDNKTTNLNTSKTPGTSTKPSSNTTSNIKAGQKVTLNSIPCYTSESAKKSYGYKSGTYYLWDNVVKNNRIRITNCTANVGKANQVTCWCDINDLKLKKTSSNTTIKTIKAKDKFVLKNTMGYNSEDAKTGIAKSGTYYAWENEGKNSRIRMTNRLNRVGVKGQVSFFCNVSDLKKL